MPSTYRTLTNRLIRQINESEISQSDFVSVKGIHSLCKDAIADSVDYINHKKYEWPFNKVAGTKVLSVGTEEYTWPTDFKVADWESFYVEKDDSLSVSTTRLRWINRDKWYRSFRESDFNSGSSGLDVPRYVFRLPDGFGVSPSPNKAYTVNYLYYNNPDRLSAHDDEVTIPVEWDWVIIAGGLWYLNLFRENPQGTSIIESKFKDGIDQMKSLLVDTDEKMEDTRVNF